MTDLEACDARRATVQIDDPLDDAVLELYRDFGSSSAAEPLPVLIDHRALIFPV